MAHVQITAANYGVEKLNFPSCEGRVRLSSGLNVNLHFASVGMPFKWNPFNEVSRVYKAL